MSTTFLLDKILREKKEKRETARIEILEKVKGALYELSKTISFDKAYIFGSLIKSGHFFENSDIDIGFICLKDEDFFKASAFLSRSLKRNVDIIQLERHRLKTKIMREGFLWTKPK